MKYFASVIVLLVVLVLPSVAFAHVVVSPKEVGVGKFQTFSVGVPVEKEIPTVGVRLVLPEGLNHVTPNVKPGWQIKVSKKGDMKGEVLNNGRNLSEEEMNEVTQIEWTGGSVPAGQRDDFLFSAQVPANESTLQWKAYQTYQDGSVVAWDQAPGQGSDHQVKPYSETKVVNDLVKASSNKETPQAKVSDQATMSNTMLISFAALILAALSLGLQFRKRK